MPNVGDEQRRLAGAAVESLVWQVARQLLGLGPADGPFSMHEDLADPDRNREVRLAALTAAELLRGELDTKIAQVARYAAMAGADYSDLGAAVGITRQGARRRWPDLAEVTKAARHSRKGAPAAGCSPGPGSR
jgi:hypothetical protein